MKLFNIGLGLFLTLLIIVGIIVLVVLLKNLNTIVEEIIETAGTETLKTAVNVSGVNITLTEGKGAISGIAVNNPKGYSNADVLNVDSVGVQLDIQSLNKDVIVIKDVYLDGVQFLVEQKNLTDTNIQALIDNLPKEQDIKEPNFSGSSSSADVRLMIESLRIGESKIKLQTQQYGGREFILPSYIQNNIGNRSTGLNADQIGEVIMSALLSHVKKAVKVELKALAKEKLDEKLDEEKGKLKKKAEDKFKEKISEKDIDKLKSLFK